MLSDVDVSCLRFCENQKISDTDVCRIPEFFTGSIPSRSIAEISENGPCDIHGPLVSRSQQISLSILHDANGSKNVSTSLRSFLSSEAKDFVDNDSTSFSSFFHSTIDNSSHSVDLHFYWLKYIAEGENERLIRIFFSLALTISLAVGEEKKELSRERERRRNVSLSLHEN